MNLTRRTLKLLDIRSMGVGLTKAYNDTRRGFRGIIEFPVRV